MKEIFHKTTNLTHRSICIKGNQNNTTKYGNKSLRSLRPQIWNSLKKQIKEETDYKCRNHTDKLFSEKCKCNSCFYSSQRLEITFNTTLDSKSYSARLWISSVQLRNGFILHVLFCKFVNFLTFHPRMNKDDY